MATPASAPRGRLAAPATTKGCRSLDEILLTVFAFSLLSLVDLVRCAVTCRWRRRLVSTEAEFICHCRSDCRCTGLAVGFLHQMPEEEDGRPSRFILLTPSRFAACASMDAVLDAGEMFRAALVVSSRNGRLVLELHRAPSRADPLTLAVVNPVTGDVRVLPTLSGKDSPGCYACALLTADDNTIPPPPPPSRSDAFLMVILVYRRSKFTACRSYPSDTGTWLPERRVSRAGLGFTCLDQLRTNGATVAVGGAVFWRANDAVISLRVDTLQVAVMHLPKAGSHLFINHQVLNNYLITVSPDGKKISVMETRVLTGIQLQVRVLEVPDDDDHQKSNGGGGRWKEARKMVYRLPHLHTVHSLRNLHLLQACEKSGILLFKGFYRGATSQISLLYQLDIEKTTQPWLIDALPDSFHWWRGKSRGSYFAYEMDPVDFLASLGGGGMAAMASSVYKRVTNKTDIAEEKQT